MAGVLEASEAAVHADSLKAAGQRRTNILWELTQSFMALSLTWAEIYLAVAGVESKALDVAFVAVVTMYFIRTNHTRVGGVGGEHVRDKR